MFVQVVQGHVTDRDAMREALDTWAAELAPGADGWLGTTAGITPEEEFIALVRFESLEAAQRNSHRPEQHQWWMDTSKLFEGGATFHDCVAVDTFLDGGSDLAGFVQVLQGRTTDPDRLWALTKRNEDAVRDFRPDIIGGVVAGHGDVEGHFTEAVYFTSEAEARDGERKTPPPELAELFAEESDLYADLRYLDLPEPWLYSPGS